MKPKLKLGLTTLLLLPAFLSLAQRDLQKLNYTEVDNHARSIRYENDIYKLTKDLTERFTDPALKLRSIFIWLTENIAYDYKFINKGKPVEVPECKGKNCAEFYKDWEFSQIKKVLKEKEGVCQGYAMALQKMCEIAGIKAEIIAGYTKSKPHQIGSAGPLDHAWNAVWIDSSWHFLDATWAAGAVDVDEETGKLLSYKKEFHPYYWATPFEDLFRDHFPKDGKWTKTGYTKERFADNPFIINYILPLIKIHTPTSGVVKSKLGDTIHFSFDYADTIDYIQVNTNIDRSPPVARLEPISRKRKAWVVDDLAMKKQKFIDFKKTGNRYEFKYVVTNASLYYIDILFDFTRVMRFKVKVERQL